MPRMGSDIPLMSKQREPNYSMNKEKDMPLIGGKKAKSKEGFSQNVKTEMEHGKPQKQAVAIAYSQARKSPKRHKEHR